MCTIPQEWEFYTVILITSDNVPTETVCGVNPRVTRSAARPTEEGRTHFPFRSDHVVESCFAQKVI